MIASARYITDIVLGILLLLPFLLVSFDTFFRALFLIITAKFISRQKAKNVDFVKQELSLIILVVANNEERIIGQTLQAILEAIKDAKSVTLALLADNCTDQTAQITANLGVKTYVRADSDPGKGKALSWLITDNVLAFKPYDLVAILDADTIIENNFVNQTRLAFLSADVKVVQSYIQPKVLTSNLIARLSCYSEILAQKIDDSARSYLGWSIPLKGKGMIFRTNVFQEIASKLSTQADDIEMSFCLLGAGILVHYCPNIQVIDLNTNVVSGLARQRGRWLIGQRQILKKIKNKIVRLLGSGLPAWSVIYAMLVKPKVMVFLIRCTLAFVVFEGDIQQHYFLLSLLLFGVLVDILYYLIGLWFVENRWKYFGALLMAPMFFLFWLVSYFYSILPGQKWLRAREE